MTGSSKNDLIKALGSAYNKGQGSSGSGRVVSESARFDGHNYARLVVSDTAEKSESRAYFDFPEAYVIRDFATVLKNCKDTSADRAARELESKFLKAAAVRDNDRVQHMIEVSRSLVTRLRGISSSNPQKVLHVMMAVEEIKKL